MKKTGILVLMMAVLTATLSGCGSSGSAAASKADTESQKSSAGEEGASGEAAIEATDLTWGTGTLGGTIQLMGTACASVLSFSVRPAPVSLQWPRRLCRLTVIMTATVKC